MGVVSIGGLLTKAVIASLDGFEASIGVIKQSPDIKDELSSCMQRGVLITKVIKDFYFRLVEAGMGLILTGSIFLFDRFGTTDPQIAVMPDLGLDIRGSGWGIGFGPTLRPFGGVWQGLTIAIESF